MSSKKYGWKGAVLLMAALLWMCAMAVSAGSASDDNSLSSLGITTEGAQVSPEFAYGTVEYSVRVPAGTSRLELDPVPTNGNAWIVDITGQDLVDGSATVQIIVSAENGSQYSYYLYVEEDASLGSVTPATESETQTETEPETETEETEPETEDPRYVRVARNSLEEAENTISNLKTEASNYRDRISVLMRILYGLIGFCVILLFVVINLLLKKKDLKAELRKYVGYGYPQGQESQETPVEGYSQTVYEDPDGGYETHRNYDGGYEAEEQQDGYGEAYDSYVDEPAAGGLTELEAAPVREKKAGKTADDPSTVPNPRAAKKKAKQMPQYERPQREYPYEPKRDKKTEDVEITMIDL